MKITISSITLLASFCAIAATAEPSIQSESKATAPIIKKMEAPKIPRSYAGTEVEMRFEIGKDGVPVKIRGNASPFDRRAAEVENKIELAIKQWRFEPAKDKNGDPKVARVTIPFIATNKITDDLKPNTVVLALKN